MRRLIWPVLTAFVSVPALQISAPQSLQDSLDRILDAPVLTRALVGARVDTVNDSGGFTRVYARNAEKLVMPASNMKLLTLAAAAENLGWDFTHETRLEAAGPIENGVLRGDLVVVGSGDPSIGSADVNGSSVFAEWARALASAGITRIDGRLIGDDDAFEDEGLGSGWSWDYLSAGYAAPAGALSYNENVAVVRATPGQAAGDPVTVALSPPGHLLVAHNELTTGNADARVSIDLLRLPGQADLTVRGILPAKGTTVVRTAAVDNPAKFFVEALREELRSCGIAVRDGAWDIDDATPKPRQDGRRTLVTRTSPPLSALAGYFVKVSQNFYGEMILKTLGTGTARAGRAVVRDTLSSWGIAPDSFVMVDGSGLSRYNYVTADAMVGVLEHVWASDRLRGPFVAALPIGGWDGTLDSRMKKTVLDGRVEAKTGTIANVRALSGYLLTTTGQRLVFSIIVNNFTAPAAEIDVVVEKALARLAINQ